MGIVENEKADQEVKKQAAMPPISMTEEIQTLAHAHRLIRKKKDQAW